VSRWVVTGVFLLLAAATASSAISASVEAAQDPTVRAWAVAGYSLLKLGVVLAFSFFVFVREPARKPSREPIAFAACAAAVAAVVVLQEPPASASTSLVVAGDLVTLASCAWLLVAVLALGRCFGVLPEARGLVTSGPYSVVRHPVYLGELGACAGLVLAAPTYWNLVVAAVFAGAQAVRMRLEERALTEEFPEYASYAARTPRLVPRMTVRPRPTPVEGEA
jgi:protein-S-isoprenylcysteine O-methyltransferase Ste14